MAPEQNMLECPGCGKLTLHLVKNPNPFVHLFAMLGVLLIYGIVKLSLAEEIVSNEIRHPGAVTGALLDSYAKIGLAWELIFGVALAIWVFGPIEWTTTKCTVCGEKQSHKEKVYYYAPGFMLFSIIITVLGNYHTFVFSTIGISLILATGLIIRWWWKNSPQSKNRKAAKMQNLRINEQEEKAETE